MEIKLQSKPTGWYYINPSGTTGETYKMYVDNDRNGGGWVLAVRIKKSSCQIHSDNNAVNFVSNIGPAVDGAVTSKVPVLALGATLALIMP
jgi:hypothetical protein